MKVCAAGSTGYQEIVPRLTGRFSSERAPQSKARMRGPM